MVNPRNQIDQWGPVDLVVLYMSFWFYQAGPGVTKAYGVSQPDMIAHLQKNRITFWWEQDFMQTNGERSIKTWLLPKTKLAKLKKDYKTVVAELEELYAQIYKGFIDQKTLGKLSTQTYNLITKFWQTCLVYELANFAIPKYLRKHLTGLVPESDMSAALETLLAPVHLSFHQQEELDLLQTFLKSQNYTKHAEKWHWVENSYWECKYLSPKYFQSRLSGMTKAKAKKKIASILNYTKSVRAKKLAVAKKYKLRKQLMSLADLLSYSIWWQDERKGYIWKFNCVTDKLAQVSSKMFNIPMEDMLTYTAEEWVKLNNNGPKVPREKLKQRLKQTALFISSKKYTLVSGPAAKRLVKPFLKKQNGKTEGKVLQGTVVSKQGAKVIGKVRILLTPRHGNTMKQGEILVAPMTSPDYVPYMRKAKAIITDVGGLMSHAAVISRELHKPCIVNTKFATKILKDGDLVEVDPNNGIVKKL